MFWENEVAYITNKVFAFSMQLEMKRIRKGNNVWSAAWWCANKMWTYHLFFCLSL